MIECICPLPHTNIQERNPKGQERKTNGVDSSTNSSSSDLQQAAAALAARMSTADWLAAGGVQRQFAAGELVFRQQARPRAFYLLLSGQVRIIKDGRDVDLLGPGAFFGEIGLLDGVPRTAAAQVADGAPADLLLLEREAFERVLAGAPDLARALTAASNERLEADSIAAAFPYLDPVAQLALAAKARRLRVGQGETILSQGDPAADLYVLVRGRAEVLHATAQGRTFMVNFLEPGEYFGEIALLSGAAHSATVRAAEDVELLRLDGQVFTAVLAAHEEAAAQFHQETARRMQRLTDLGE